MTDSNPIEDILDNIIMNDSALDISNSIKDALFAKTASKIDSIRPNVYNSIFDEDSSDNEES